MIMAKQRLTDAEALDVVRRYIICTEKLKNNDFEDWNDGMVTKQEQEECYKQMLLFFRGEEE